MDATVRARLAAGGVNVDETLARFGGNEAMLLKYLRRFPSDTSYAALEAAMAAGGREAIKVACHTLKGVSGTLGLSPLYEASGAMMAELRSSDQTDVSALFASVQAAYRQATALIAELDAG